MFDLRYVEGFEHVERCSCWCCWTYRDICIDTFAYEIDMVSIVQRSSPL